MKEAVLYSITETNEHIDKCSWNTRIVLFISSY